MRGAPQKQTVQDLGRYKQPYIKNEIKYLMEEVSEYPLLEEKIYKISSILLSAIIGGPLASIFLIKANFKVFHNLDNGKRILIYVFLGIAGLCEILFYIYSWAWGTGAFIEEWVIINGIFAIIIFIIVKISQGSRIDKHIYVEGKAYEWWRSLIIGLVSAFLFGILVIIGSAINFIIYMSMHPNAGS